jgi:hypothetical protein
MNIRITVQNKDTGLEIYRDYQVDETNPDQYGLPLADMIEQLADTKMPF